MARKRGVRDYSREIWQEAVQCYLRVIGDENRKWVQKHKRVLAPENGRRGGKPSFYQQAHADLKHRVFTDSCDSDRVNGMSDKMFRDVVKRHICGVVKQGTCYRRRRTQPEGPLSFDEREEAARCLGTPVQDAEGYRFNRSGADAYERCARFMELCDKAGVQPDTLARNLLAEFPHILCRGKIDQRDALTDSTRKEREKASDVWGGRAVWRVSKHPDKNGNGVVRGGRNVFWHSGRNVSHKNRWPYYNKYTFLMDAGTISSGDPTVSKDGEVGFFRLDEIFPPEEVRASEAVGNQIQLMFYIVIHRTLGIVCGPDFMYTGSRSSTSKRQKHVQSFKCWYAPLVATKFFLASNSISFTLT